MKKKTNIIAAVAIAFAAGIFYTGCEKREEVKDIIDTDTSSATDNAVAEGAFTDVFTDVNDRADSVEDFRSSCPTYTVVGTLSGTVVGYPKTLTIDYGTGCNGKKGSITAVFSGPFKTTGTVVTVTYNNFYDGNYKVNADSHTITNSGNNVYNVNVTNATLVSSEGTIVWNAAKKIVWSEGSSTKATGDDVFLVSGTRDGTSAKGVKYTVVVEEATPLKVANSCDNIVSGIMTITPYEKKARVIDFGDGTCDDKAKVTISGNAYDINI
jgi:hypothetical protein